MIYFKFIFVKCAKSASRFIFLHVNVLLFQYHLFEDDAFFVELPVFLSQRSAGCICVGLFLGLDTDLSVFSLIPYCLYCCSFIISKSCAEQRVVS